MVATPISTKVKGQILLDILVPSGTPGGPGPQLTFLEILERTTMSPAQVRIGLRHLRQGEMGHVLVCNQHGREATYQITDTVEAMLDYVQHRTREARGHSEGANAACSQAMHFAQTRLPKDPEQRVLVELFKELRQSFEGATHNLGLADKSIRTHGDAKAKRAADQAAEEARRLAEERQAEINELRAQVAALTASQPMAVSVS